MAMNALATTAIDILFPAQTFPLNVSFGKPRRNNATGFEYIIAKLNSRPFGAEGISHNRLFVSNGLASIERSGTQICNHASILLWGAADFDRPLAPKNCAAKNNFRLRQFAERIASAVGGFSINY